MGIIAAIGLILVAIVTSALTFIPMAFSRAHQ